MVDASVFAYLADGKNGLRVLQIALARGFCRFLWFQPAAHAQADCHLSH